MNLDRPENTPLDDAPSPVVRVVLQILNRRKIIAMGAVIFLFLAVSYLIVASDEYTSTARVVREAGGEGAGLSGGLAALGGLGGINLSSLSSGLSPEAYPAILESRAVRLAVARDTFYFEDKDRFMTFVDYHDQEGLKDWLGEWIPFLRPDTLSRRSFELPTEEEENAIERLSESVSSSVDIQSGIMTIQVVWPDASVASAILDRLLVHLRSRVQEIRTEKARQTLLFVEERFSEVQEELKEAEEQLAAFTDQNQNITAASLRTRRDRLQRQVSFKSQLYSELQKQVAQSRLDLQRSEPVITVVEEPVPPLEKSGPNTILILILLPLVGAILTTALCITYDYVAVEHLSDEQQAMVEKRLLWLVPSRLRTWL
jgi:uncharacterized protein involved in exopolysaccharide biosynthesis